MVISKPSYEMAVLKRQELIVDDVSA